MFSPAKDVAVERKLSEIARNQELETLPGSRPEKHQIIRSFRNPWLSPLARTVQEHAFGAPGLERPNDPAAEEIIAMPLSCSGPHCPPQQRVGDLESVVASTPSRWFHPGMSPNQFVKQIDEYRRKEQNVSSTTAPAMMLSRTRVVSPPAIPKIWRRRDK